MSTREEKAAMLAKGLMDNYNRPMFCKKCEGILIFKGVGEYKCEDCGAVEYDDYGKVRNYLEKNAGATTAEVADATGVSQKSIRDMLKESRIEIAANSNTFMKCEICGAVIRSGRFCDRCQTAYHKEIEEKARNSRNLNMSGFSTERAKGDEGAKRFTRDM